MRRLRNNGESLGYSALLALIVAGGASPALAADGTRWYVRGDGYTKPNLVRQKPGEKPRALRAVETDVRLAASPGGDLILVQPEICGNYNYYYDLERLGPDGKARRLGECGRYRLAAPLDDGRTVAVQMENGQAEAVVLGGGAVYRAAPGESITGIAARGSTIVVTTLRDGRWSLIAITDGKPQTLLSDTAIKHSPRIGEGDEIYFIGDYGKVYNVWSVRQGGRLSRWTQAAHGVREMSAPHRGEILLTTIEPDGDALRSYRLPASALETMAAPAAESRPASEVSSVALPDRAYTPWS
jgi:hypothetical protein